MDKSDLFASAIPLLFSSYVAYMLFLGARKGHIFVRLFMGVCSIIGSVSVYFLVAEIIRTAPNALYLLAMPFLSVLLGHILSFLLPLLARKNVDLKVYSGESINKLGLREALKKYWPQLIGLFVFSPILTILPNMASSLEIIVAILILCIIVLIGRLWFRGKLPFSFWYITVGIIVLGGYIGNFLSRFLQQITI